MKRKISTQQFIIVFICLALLSIGCRLVNVDEDSLENIDSGEKSDFEEMKYDSLKEKLSRST